MGSFFSKNFRAQTELFDTACGSLSLFKQTKIPTSALDVKVDLNLICILFSGFVTLSFRALGAVEFQPKAFSLEALSLNQFESKVIHHILTWLDEMAVHLLPIQCRLQSCKFRPSGIPSHWFESSCSMQLSPYWYADDDVPLWLEKTGPPSLTRLRQTYGGKDFALTTVSTLLLEWMDPLHW